MQALGSGFEVLHLQNRKIKNSIFVTKFASMSCMFMIYVMCLTKKKNDLRYVETKKIDNIYIKKGKIFDY